MPHRFMPPYVAELMVGMSLAVVTLATEILRGIGTGPIIYDALSLRLLCLCGSVGGALVSVLVFPPREGKGSPVRQMAVKFLASGLSGAILTPALMRWFGVELVGDYVLASSAAVAMLSVTFLQEAIPAIVGKILSKFSVAQPLDELAIRESRERKDEK